MPYENDELNKRAAQRREYARKRQAAQKRRAIRNVLALAAIVIVCCVIIGVLVSRTETPEDPTISTTLPPVTTLPPETKPNTPETVIKLTFGGDVNITDASVAAGLINGNYNFTEVFRDVVPALADADLTVLNFEGNLCGAPYGSQSASAPQALVEALKAAGVDMLQLANSYTISNGIIGMKQTCPGGAGGLYQGHGQHGSACRQRILREPAL